MAADSAWYYAKNDKPVGPLDLEALVAAVTAAAGGATLVFGPGMSDWTEARHIASIAERLKGAASIPPPPKYSGFSNGTKTSDVIDYEIFGTEMQYAEITLDPGETVIAEPGMFMYMTPGIKMETVFGDPSAGKQSVWGKMMSAGKRMLTGESLFVSTFTNAGQKQEQIAFAAPYPGKIIPMHLDLFGGELICQKDSFMAAARGVKIGIAFQKKILTGLFGGEGFIMQRLQGDGLALVHAGGTMMRRTLAAGEVLKLDTGCLVAITPSVDYDIQMVGGIKNTLFGGEGLFFATLTGPGEVWVQSLPFSRLAGRMAAASTGGKEEGSILGGLGGLLDGDNR